MHLRTYPNTPLWFDLALATGAIALAYWLDQVIHADRRSPRPVGAFAPEERERADHEDIDREEGAIGRRASQEPHSWQLARFGWKDILWPEPETRVPTPAGSVPTDVQPNALKTGSLERLPKAKNCPDRTERQANSFRGPS